MARFGLLKSKRDEDESVALNSIPTAQRKHTTAVGVSALKIETADLDDGPVSPNSRAVIEGGPMTPNSPNRAAALMRRVISPKSPPPPAEREDFSMASGSTWTTKATDLPPSAAIQQEGPGATHTDAAGNPVAPPNANIDARDEAAEGKNGNNGNGNGNGALRRKFKKSALAGGHKTDNTNISLVYNSFGPQASKVMNLVLRDKLPVPKSTTDVIVQVEVSLGLLIWNVPGRKMVPWTEKYMSCYVQACKSLAAHHVSLIYILPFLCFVYRPPL